MKIKDITAEHEPIATHLRAQLRQQAHEIERLRQAIGAQQELANAIRESVAAAEPYPAHCYTPARRGKVVIAPVLKLSDWHIGEIIEPREVEGLNRFNWTVAQRGVLSILNDFLQWVEIRRRSFAIHECHLLAEGDYISGDIHPELSATNEFPVPVQTEKAGHLLGEVGRVCAAHFERVHLHMVGSGNHDRTTKKPAGKQRTSNSWSYLVHAIACQALSVHRNVTLDIATGAKHVVTINGVRFLTEHGDTVRGWAGHPYYGFGRAIGREATRRMGTPLDFRYWSIGHWHVPAFIEDRTIVNGSLSGTSEFDHLNGRLSRPSQVAFCVHKQYGLFDFTPFWRKV